MSRRLIVSYVLLVAIALLAFKVPISVSLTSQLRSDTEAAVQRDATAMALLLANGDPASRDALTRTAQAYEEETPGRVDVLASWDGGNTADWTDGALVVTVPAPDDGAVRISYPTRELSNRLWEIWEFRALLALGVLGVATVLGASAVRRLTRPLRELHTMATRLGDGDLTARCPETGPPETRTLARTLNSSAERLETLITAQQVFVADASHQLRTPLTALRLSLDNIADEVADSGAREDAEQASAEVLRMSRLVNGLLVLARAEATARATESVDLAGLVGQRLALWRPEADERGVWLQTSGAYDAGWRVQAAPGHLEQVLDNLLSNALAVSPRGSTVSLHLERCRDRVVLAVCDEGPGMSDAEKARAFDRFWRGRGLTGGAGSGLGLAIVRQLVTDDGGSVALSDAPTGGLCVRVSLRPAAATSGD